MVVVDCWPSIILTSDAKPCIARQVGLELFTLYHNCMLKQTQIQAPTYIHLESVDFTNLRNKIIKYEFKE